MAANHGKPHADPFRQYGDASGPERMFSFYDPPTQMRAVIVIDTTAFGISAGGVRMLPDLSLTEMIRLARAMTYKYLMLDVRCGGAKAGVWYDPARHDRQAVLTAFLTALRPFFEKRLYLPGADMGTSEADFQPLRDRGSGGHYSGLRSQLFEGLPIEDQLTGFGVVEAARTAAEFFAVPFSGARVAIEGFGKVGGGAARFFARAGARVVAVSTLAGTRFDPQGVDVDRLLALRQAYGDDAVCHYPQGKLLPRDRLFTLPADILIPGARPDAIHGKNVGRVQAKLVVPGANIPFTRAVANQLSGRGVGVVPDFVSNGGGVLAALADIEGLDVAGAFRSVRERIGANTALVLRHSREHGRPPFDAALEIIRERWQHAAPSDRALATEP
ncbi:MAG TPA: Glu/Leu/Phe/Val dehydrogenase dimerization domain-containing protein [Candidatus Binatia bacterium]|nr:Glu/Leu/Phe/Val dehydrogenase dimerization domain-containing protein [Candidatus Binatia bacterium]